MPVVMSQAHPLTRRARVHRHVCVMCASIVPGQQIHSDESQEAFEDSGYFSKISDNSVVLSLSLHTSLSLLSFESLSSSSKKQGKAVVVRKSHQNF